MKCDSKNKKNVESKFSTVLTDRKMLNTLTVELKEEALNEAHSLGNLE